MVMQRAAVVQLYIVRHAAIKRCPPGPQVVGLNMPLSQQAGYYCSVCDCILRDSQSYLDHINGKWHNRALGMTMRVEKSTVDQVTAACDHNIVYDHSLVLVLSVLLNNCTHLVVENCKACYGGPQGIVDQVGRGELPISRPALLASHPAVTV